MRSSRRTEPLPGRTFSGKVVLPKAPSSISDPRKLKQRSSAEGADLSPAQELERFTFYLKSNMKLSDFKYLHKNRTVSFVPSEKGKNGAGITAKLKGAVYDTHFLFRPADASANTAGTREDILERIELIPGRSRRFQTYFSSVFRSIPQKNLTVQIDSGILLCEVYLVFPCRKIVLNGISVQFRRGAVQVIVKEIKRDTAAFHKWKEKIRALPVRNGLIEVMTFGGKKICSPEKAQNLLTLSPRELEKFKLALMRTYGRKVQIVFER